MLTENESEFLKLTYQQVSYINLLLKQEFQKWMIQWVAEAKELFLKSKNS